MAFSRTCPKHSQWYAVAVLIHRRTAVFQRAFVCVVIRETSIENIDWIYQGSSSTCKKREGPLRIRFFWNQMSLLVRTRTSLFRTRLIATLRMLNERECEMLYTQCLSDTCRFRSKCARVRSRHAGRLSALSGLRTLPRSWERLFVVRAACASGVRVSRQNSGSRVLQQPRARWDSSCRLPQHNMPSVP